jgi:acyl-CoA synthetase (AMP-forming)/AMP-acid ligase II
MALGVRPGDRLALVGENTVDAIILLLGAQSMDAWPAMINARLPWREIEAVLDLIDARLSVFPLDGSPAAHDHAGLVNAVPVPLPSCGAVAASEPRHDSSPEPVQADPAEQCALLLMTSGSTGLPKAVMLSHGALTTMGEILAATRKIAPGDTVSGVAPLSHMLGISIAASTLCAGASLALSPRLAASEMVTKICSGELTHLAGVPTVYTRLLDHIVTQGTDVSSHRLSYVACGGAPLDPGLKLRVEALFGLPMVNAYGMTECMPLCRSPPRWDNLAQSVGPPEPGVAVKIVDPFGTEVRPGEIGELWARSATAMLGYYRNPEATKLTLREGGWIATGDLASLLPNGEVAIVGRAKEMIIRSGFNVYPAEVEAAINSHPAVLQSAVAGRRTPDGNEEVIAFVQLRRALGGPELTTHLRERIASYKIPSLILFRDELPVGSTGKILKRALLEHLIAEHQPRA